MGTAARFPGRLSWVAAGLAVSLLAPAASSQTPTELAKARERFKEAAALQAAGDFARALEGYKEVALVKSSAQVRFNIASCEEKTGDYVRAVGSYRLALTEATKSNSKDIEASVQKALSDLEPRIPVLLVKRGAGAAVADVTLDGRPLANPSIGVEFQINPGPHAIRATAEGSLPFVKEINLADRQHETVTIVLKPKPAEAPVAAPLPPIVEAPLPPPPPPPNPRPLRYAGIAVGGAGVVALAASAAFFAMRQKAISDLNAVCGADHLSCPASAQSTYDSGTRDATVAGAMFGVGLPLLLAGGVMIGVSTRTPKPTTGLVVMPGGAGIRGAF